ncbi:MAG: glucosamine-6-phosphate deaminase [Planctomycetaceae bacterium]|jgi:glucosamine-6-phosphate deaminase|nr:glucosamine-6-phosphate deaminase [Planctomycetaceae bacterium]
MILRFDNATLNVHPNRFLAGQVAGNAAAAAVRNALEKKKRVRMVFAAAPSQNETLAALVTAPGVDWMRVIAFHMDEYIGLPANAPQRFTRYLRDRIFSKLPFAEIHLLNGIDPEKLCKEYSEKLAAAPIDVVCLGIGENGHIAFNDPPIADFNDPKLVKIVDLDEACRQQQVNDGCFSALDGVPKRAVSLTIPALMRGECLICTVPGKRKHNAVRTAMEQPVSPSCPASILRTHPNCTLFIDQECWRDET